MHLTSLSRFMSEGFRSVRKTWRSEKEVELEPARWENVGQIKVILNEDKVQHT